MLVYTKDKLRRGDHRPATVLFFVKREKMNFIDLPTLVKIKILEKCDFYSKIYLRSQFDHGLSLGLVEGSIKLVDSGTCQNLKNIYDREDIWKETLVNSFGLFVCLSILNRIV